jgi:hypothetical protein
MSVYPDQEESELSLYLQAEVRKQESAAPAPEAAWAKVAAPAAG